LIFGQAIQSRFSNKRWARTPRTLLITKIFKYTKLVLIEQQRNYVTALKLRYQLKHKSNTYTNKKKVVKGKYNEY